jgi:2-dehydropantoate 2-reductase
MDRICVFGAGAVGGYLAARLAHAGREVSVVARGAHLAAIRQDGLRLVTPEESFVTHLAASSDPSDLGPQDLVVVAVKAPALPEVARAIGPLLGPGTPVAFAMNGVQWWYGHGFAPGGHELDLSRLDPGGALDQALGPDRALGMIVYSPNEVIEPGVVRNGGGRNRFVLGDPAGPRSERVETVRAALAGAGFTVEATDDIRHEMWLKLVRNVSTGPLCALTGARASDIVDDPGTRAVARAMVVEALAVAASHGFALGIDPDASSRPGTRPVHKPSMLQDLERGRPMEIDAILGMVVDFAAQAGVPTPTLSTVLALLSLRARGAGLQP